MEKTLTKPSPRPCADSPSTLESLIEEWIPKLGINAGAALDAETQAVYKAIWLEGLCDLSPEVLLASFRKTLRGCPYWPIKVADIRKHVDRVKQAALPEEASEAWQRVLAIRRNHYNPDFPQHLARALAELPERIRRAARAAGVFQEVSDPDQLHVWGKKRFIESYLASEALEQDQYLLPDGEIKNLLAQLSRAKALPVPQGSETSR
jgi:hypothetical protein